MINNIIGRKRNIMSPLLETWQIFRRDVIFLHSNLNVLGGEKVKSKYRGTSIKEKYSLIFNLNRIVGNWERLF